jgi:hypothetical protein
VDHHSQLISKVIGRAGSPSSVQPSTYAATKIGAAVTGLVSSVPASRAGMFNLNNRASSTPVGKCTGAGMKAMNRPSANARVTLRRLRDQ